MKVLITGASGFVARCVEDQAALAGHETLGLSRSSAGGRASINWANGSSDLARRIEQFAPDVIFHGAGSASVHRSITDPEGDRAASVGTWQTLLESVRLSGSKPLVFFPSSAAVYGNPDMLPVAENAPAQPISPYGTHKVESEALGRLYRETHGIPVFVFRFFSLFGSRQRRLLLWELFERAAGPETMISLAGTGKETRDYLHEDAVGRAVISFAESTLRRGAESGGEWIFNVASGRELSVLEVAHAIRDLLAVDKPVVPAAESRAGSPVRWKADVTKFAEACPEWESGSFEEGLKRTLDRWKADVSA